MIQILENLKVVKDIDVYKSFDLDSSFCPLDGKLCSDERAEGIILDTREIDLDEYKNLRVISRVGVGLDNIDLEECKKRGIKVYNTPCDELTNSVAEFTVMQILNFLRNKRETIYGKTVGIIGYGRIGTSVEFIFNNGFELDTYWHDKFQKEIGENYHYHLEEVLDCDIICIHISGSKEVIGEKEISRMKQKPIIVNMARSGCVNLKFIYKGLKEEKLSGFISDVDEDIRNIWTFSNSINNKILITPHVASDTIQARTAIENFALQNLIKGLKG